MYEFVCGMVFYFQELDINQEVYGLLEYLLVFNVMWLNELVMLFCWKYYKNGLYVGFILYMIDVVQMIDDVVLLCEVLRSVKGLGNFKNLFLYVFGGKKDGVQILFVLEVVMKDEFWNIKSVMCDDQFVVYWVLLQFMGIILLNIGGFGDVEKVVLVFVWNEVKLLQDWLLVINEWVGEEVVWFEEYGFL